MKRLRYRSHTIPLTYWVGTACWTLIDTINILFSSHSLQLPQVPILTCNLQWLINPPNFMFLAYVMKPMHLGENSHGHREVQIHTVTRGSGLNAGCWSSQLDELCHWVTPSFLCVAQFTFLKSSILIFNGFVSLTKRFCRASFCSLRN